MTTRRRQARKAHLKASMTLLPPIPAELRRSTTTKGFVFLTLIKRSFPTRISGENVQRGILRVISRQGESAFTGAFVFACLFSASADVCFFLVLGKFSTHIDLGRARTVVSFAYRSVIYGTRGIREQEGRTLQGCQCCWATRAT